MNPRTARLTDAYVVGVELRNLIRDGSSLCEAISECSGPFERLDDGYSSWHPAPYSFRGMLRLFLYREITQSYRELATYPELADLFGLERIPEEPVLFRTWRKRFDEGVREFITIGAHYVVKEIHDLNLGVPAARPKAEVATSREGPDEAAEDNQSEKYTDEQIYRTTRLARQYGFDGFDSGRAGNATYEDKRFFELQTFMGMVSCGTPQGAARFQYRHGHVGSPHGDTHLRVVKQFKPAQLIDGFDVATDRLLSVIESEASFRRPVTAAIDITTVPYYGDVDGIEMVSGLNQKDRAFKFATLSIVGLNIPFVLAIEPVRESSAWDDNPPNQIHRVVRRLIRRAKRHVPIETVLCDREFDSMRVFQTLSNLGVNYLIPKRITSSEREVVEQMDEDGQEVAVESASVHVETGYHRPAVRRRARHHR